MHKIRLAKIPVHIRTLGYRNLNKINVQLRTNINNNLPARQIFNINKDEKSPLRNKSRNIPQFDIAASFGEHRKEVSKIEQNIMKHLE